MSARPDLVIIVLVSEVNHANGLQRNSFNFNNVDVNRNELTSTCTSKPSEVYTQNVANGLHINNYITFV